MTPAGDKSTWRPLERRHKRLHACFSSTLPNHGKGVKGFKFQMLGFSVFFGGTRTGTSKIWNRKKVPEPVREVVKKKNGLFTVRLTVRGGGRGSAPSALTVSKCENFDPLIRA